MPPKQQLDGLFLRFLIARHEISKRYFVGMLVADRTRNHIMTKYFLPLRSKLARRRRLSRLLRVEHLEPRQLLNVDWRNPLDGLDVDNDSFISPLDALVIINDLNEIGRAHV